LHSWLSFLFLLKLDSSNIVSLLHWGQSRLTLKVQSPNNMSAPVDSKSPSGDLGEVEAQPAHLDYAADIDEKAKLSAFKAGAIEAENNEHNMGVLEALKLYPMAAFWAFVMSSTIVRCPSPVYCQ
jgi:SP family general alpha glucoside:H+ symporter-like MFS transporter